MPVGTAIPGGITDLSGQAKDGALFLNFSVPPKMTSGSALEDLAGFRIVKSCGSCLGAFEPFKTIHLDEQKGYTVAGGKIYVYDDDLIPGYEYRYKAYPFTKRGSLGDPSNVFVIKWEKTPGPPERVTATIGDKSVGLTWVREAPYLYNIYRYDQGVYPVLPVNEKPLAKSSYLDAGLTNGTEYTYSVRALIVKDGKPWEGEGTQVKATPKDVTPPSAPIGVTAMPTDSGIQISWIQGKETDIIGYNVYRSAPGKKTKLNQEPVTESVYLDPERPKQRYATYYVTALDTSGNESEPSKEAVVILER